MKTLITHSPLVKVLQNQGKEKPNVNMFKKIKNGLAEGYLKLWIQMTSQDCHLSLSLHGFVSSHITPSFLTHPVNSHR